MSDSLTFGALLYAIAMAESSTPNWPTPFHSQSIVNATIMTAFLTSSLTMVFAVRASASTSAPLQVAVCKERSAPASDDCAPMYSPP